MKLVTLFVVNKYCLCSDSKTITLLTIQSVHYTIHNSTSLVPVLKKTNPLHTLPSYLRSIIISFSYLLLGLPSSLNSPHQNPACLFPLPVSTTYHIHLIILNLTTLIICGEQYKLWNSSLCTFLRFSCHFLPINPTYLPQHSIFQHPQPTFCH